jgi:hypothetical protein
MERACSRKFGAGKFALRGAAIVSDWSSSMHARPQPLRTCVGAFRRLYCAKHAENVQFF